MCEELRLERYDNSPWGFRMTGGLDFGTPLSIIKVTGGSIAEEAGVHAGDLLKNINGKPTTHFTHLDAQKCIASAGNYLTLTVVRGSIVTPPATPLQRLSPAPSYKSAENEYIPHDSPTIMKTDAENEIMDYYKKECNMRDGSRSPAPVYQKTAGQNATMTKNKAQYRVNDNGQLLLGDRALSDFEIAELLTSNEEVLDQGILGINFKKFLPKVDFIRKSEVFKMLQNENTRKDISEQAQLQKEPSKRFSTFLMKPKSRGDTPPGWTFVKFKPPRYLPKQPEKKWELPKLKPWERPKRKDPEHSVLWLFMEEKGEEIIDERYGTEEEERLNLSRNSFIEYDRSSMSSSMRMHEDDTCSITSKDQYQYGRESQLSHVEESDQRGFLGEKRSDNEELCESNKVIKKPKFVIDAENIENVETISTENVNIEELKQEKIQEEAVASEERRITEKRVDSRLFQQLADIQSQIAALENDAPSDLQTQLLQVKEQLNKIVQIKSAEETKVEHSYEEQVAEESYSRSVEHAELMEECRSSGEFSEQHHLFESQEISEVQENFSSAQDYEVTNSSRDTSVVGKSVETKEFSEHKSEKHIEFSTYQVEELEETDFQLCIAPSPKPQPKKKPPAHPITPQLRPIVLPGGRMWRQPKDAEHEEFYQGILVAQAEVLIGTNESLNYTKYMPPKVDMTTSEVYRLIHETEEGKDWAEKKQEPNVCSPISKRHFYAATLREPPPIGVVELSDL